MKRIIAIFACVVILCSCLVINAFAYSDIDSSGLVSASDILVSGSSTLKRDSATIFAKGSTTYMGFAFLDDTSKAYHVSNNSQFFVFFVGNTSYIACNNPFYSSNIIVIGQGYFSNGNAQSSTNWSNGYSLDSTTNIYYASGYSLFTGTSKLVNTYSTLQDGLTAASAAISGAISPPVSISSVSIPAGNVAYIKTNGSQILDLTTTFVQYSQLFSDSWANITQKVTWTNTLPVGTVTFPLAGMSSLAWEKTGNTNILGQTQNASASYQTVANQYFVIYNPLYQQYGQGDNYDMNGTIHVSGDITEVKVYPLSGSVVTGQGLVSNSDSDYSDYFELQDDGNGGIEWVDQSGNVSTGPQTGGTSLLPQEATIQTLAAQILQVITKVGQSIANIFNVGHQAIVTLVGHASEFVSHFQSLYTWLPADIFAVLSSAIILAITIGIIKVFI